MPDRGQHDVSGPPPPAPAAVQLSEMGPEEVAGSSGPEEQAQHRMDTVLVVGSGERQPLMGAGHQDTQGSDAADLATPGLLAVDAEDPALTSQQPVMQPLHSAESPDAAPVDELEPGLLERVGVVAPERRSFGRAESAPSAAFDAAAHAALAATQTGGGFRARDHSEGELADSSALEPGAMSRAADLARRPSQPLEAGLGHDRLAIRTSVQAFGHDGASSSKGDAAGPSSSAAAGDDSPVMRSVSCIPPYLPHADHHVHFVVCETKA